MTPFYLRCGVGKVPRHPTLTHPLRRACGPIGKAVIASISLFLASWGPVASAATKADLPHWFWTQSSEGLLGPNIVLDRTLNGYRFWCWQSALNGTIGVYILASTPVSAATPAAFSVLTEPACRVLTKYYGTR